MNPACAWPSQALHYVRKAPRFQIVALSMRAEKTVNVHVGENKGGLEAERKGKGVNLSRSDP